VLTTVAALSPVLLFFVLKKLDKALDSYSEEKGKLQAQHEDLRRLIERTGELTKTTELIKAGIGHNVWTEQTRWTFKKDRYVALISSLSRWQKSYNSLLLIVGLEEKPSGQTFDGPLKEKLAKNALDQMSLVEKLNDQSADFAAELQLSSLLISSKSYQIVKRFFEDQPILVTAEEYAARVQTIEYVIATLCESAREDLGYSPIRKTI
jgi:hypothetical protein